jgi:uncharacterized protein
LLLNGSPLKPDANVQRPDAIETACGYSPHAAAWARITRTWQPGDELEIEFSLPIRTHQQHRRVPQVGGMAALSRGPLVYCLESLDNSGDIFNTHVNPDGLEAVWRHDLLGGTMVLQGGELTFIPYLLWGNRGRSQMTMFVNRGGSHAG